MKVRTLLVALPLCAGACSSIPIVGGPSDQERRAPCDRLAAQAIQSESLEQAKQLAAQASECYSRAQGG